MRSSCRSQPAVMISTSGGMSFKPKSSARACNAVSSSSAPGAFQPSAKIVFVKTCSSLASSLAAKNSAASFGP